MRGASLAQTSALVAVLDHKSFTKAAKRLGLSTARVSDMVRALEERLGVRLVERTTRSVAPTAAGERLLERLRPVLDEYQAALESTSEFRNEPAGQLRLTVAPPAADLFLEDALPRFLAVHPEISVEVSIDAAVVDIVAGRFDAGVRTGEYLARDMIAVRIGRELPLVVVASPDYLARWGEPQSLRALAEHHCIRIRLPTGAFVPWRFRAGPDVSDVHVEARLAVNNDRFALRAAIEGVGLLQAPRDYVGEDLAAGRLMTVLGNFAPASWAGFFLYYSSRRQTRPALRALADFLRAKGRKVSDEEAAPSRREIVKAVA